MSLKTLHLPKGYALTLSTDAVSSGYYGRAGQPGDSTSYGLTTLAASSSVELGPFNEERYYKIDTIQGSVTDSQAFAGLVDQDNVDIDGGTINDVTITDATLASLLTSSLNTGSIESVSGLTMTAKGCGILNQVELTLDSVSVAITSTSTANGFGGIKLYNYPSSHLYTLGAVCELSISIPSADQADYTDATPEGDLGLGTVIIANADAMGTDATDDNIATANSFTMAAYADALVPLEPEGVGYADNVAGTRAANLNVLVDAADIDNDVATTVEVSGTIIINYIALGSHTHE